MKFVTIPVLNGLLPRPGGGRIKGAFLDELSKSLLESIGVGGVVFLCPYAKDRGTLYPAGVTGRIDKLWYQDVFVTLPSTLYGRGANVGGMRKVECLFADISGEERARARRFQLYPPMVVVAEDVTELDLSELRSRGYPCIDGAGWRALGGHTEAKGLGDLPVTIYGNDLEKGTGIGVTGNVGDDIGLEQAHTVEHGIIRSLSQYGLCTPRNLKVSIQMESAELKESLDAGFAFRMPEVFGVTSGGVCGNPLTNLAHVYLTREIVKGLGRGESLFDSYDHARNRTLSKLADDLEITTSAGLRIMQGLKRGMLHEDTILSTRRLVKVLDRFPQNPWS